MFQKSIAAAAALAVTGFVSTGFASAQTGGTGGENDNLVNLSGVSLKLSVGIPYDDGLRRGLGATLVGLGFEFQPNRSLLRESETYFSAEIFLRDLGATDGYVIPITVNQRFYSSRVTGANVRRSYGFVGVGFAFTDADDQGGTSGALAIRGGLGAEIGERLFFEGALLFGAGEDRIRPNIISFSGGYRF